MKIYVTKNYTELSKLASILTLNFLLERPGGNLGLATGDTPLGLYKEMVQAQKDLGVDLSAVQFFHLDEYLGLGKGHPSSYAAYLQKNFFSPLEIPQENIHLLNGLTRSPKREAQRYEISISYLGGIDFQILGIGENGHIGFNEPGTSFSQGVHISTLSESTQKANSSLFSDEKIPDRALTMGLRNIMETGKVLLLASGKKKALAVKQALQGNITEDVPASILQNHDDATLVMDTQAASLLDHKPIRMEAQTLEVFSQETLFSEKKIAVISPHPDDSSISCGGTLAMLAEKNCLHTVCMSSGHRAPIPGKKRSARKALRLEEAEAEAKLLHSSLHLLDLKFYDNEYAFYGEDAAALADSLQSIGPDLVFLPSRNDRHPAHKASHLLAMEALRRMLREHPQPDSFELWFYEGPWNLFERDEFNTIICLTRPAERKKMQAIKKHHSQVSRKRYDFAAQSLARFRAVITPESRVSQFGEDAMDLGEFVEIYQREILTR